MESDELTRLREEVRRIQEQTAELRKEAAEERARREEVEKRLAELIASRKELDRGTTGALAQRDEAERLAPERREEAISRHALHDAMKIGARAALLEPLPNYSPKTVLVDDPSTKLKWNVPIPHRIAEWSDFPRMMNALLERVAAPDLYVTKRIDVFQPESIAMNHEVFMHNFVGSIVRHLVGILREALGIPDLELILGEPLSEGFEGGLPDIAVTFRGKTVFVMQFRPPRIRLETDDNVTQMSEEGNRYAMTLQTYGYMITKGNLVYSFFTNYDQWFFLKRTIVDSQHILQTTQAYDRSQARLALAAFIVNVIESPPEGLTLGVFGAPGVVDIPPPPQSDDPRFPGGPSTSSSSSGDDIVRFTTTKAVLGVTSLSVHARMNSIRLHVSEKASTFRYRSGEHDLVWRQFDIYGLPRHCSDYSRSDLRDMVCREVQAYEHLRDHWGTLVPRFIYCGQDFFVLWVFVTSFEGIDLRTLSKQRGGLTQDVKNKAMESLIQLHALKVIHGDVALRHILFREKDAKVLWIDFGFSSIGGDRFAQHAEQELQSLEIELNSIPTEISSPVTKRIKVE